MEILSLVVLSILVLLLWKESRKKIVQIPPHFDVSPDAVVFAFDLHQVLVQPNHLNMARLLLSQDGRNFALAVLRPHILLSAIRICGHFFYHNLTQKKGIVVEELFFRLADKHPEISVHLKFFTIIANCFDVDPGAITILKKLKSKGYTLFLLSNIGSRFFEDMKKQHPFLAENFDECYCSTHKDGYLKKPNLGYYDIFVSRYCSVTSEERKDESSPGTNSHKLIVFIDDKIANLQAALDSQFGDRFYPIYFHDAQLLEKQLSKWKFL